MGQLIVKFARHDRGEQNMKSDFSFRKNPKKNLALSK